MFTGLIHTVGKISDTKNEQGGKTIEITVDTKEFRGFENVKTGDSISVNGVCTTVISLSRNAFKVNLMQESLKRINQAGFNRENSVNIEPAMKLTDGLHGHIVTGHIDTVGKIQKITDKGISKIFSIETETRYVVEKGSIALNGVSLTVAKVENGLLEVSLIPHTLQNTNFKNLRENDFVNVEFDILAKYIEKFTNLTNNNCETEKSGIDENFLRENGF